MFILSAPVLTIGFHMPGLSISFPAGRALAWWRLQPDWRPDFLSILVPHAASDFLQEWSTLKALPKDQQATQLTEARQASGDSKEQDLCNSGNEARLDASQARKKERTPARLWPAKPSLLAFFFFGHPPNSNAKKVAVLTATQAESHLHLPHLEAFEYPSSSESLSNK